MASNQARGAGAPRRVLSTLDGVILVVGLVLGAGIFRAPQMVAAGTSSDATFLLLWLVGGLVSLTGALCYAELAAAYPNAGGEYHFLSRAFGRRAGFLCAWSRMTVIQTGSIALLSFLVGDYVATLLGNGEPRTGVSAIVAAGVVVGLTLVLTTGAVYLGLWLFLRHTRWGIRMRAVGQNPLLAAQRGIGLHAIYALAWSLATFTGGLAGMLIASDSALDQGMVIIGLKAFPAALVGGLDSLLGTLLGALIIAIAEVLVIHYVIPLLADVVPFLVLLATLILRPWGLRGTREELDRV